MFNNWLIYGYLARTIVVFIDFLYHKRSNLLDYYARFSRRIRDDSLSRVRYRDYVCTHFLNHFLG